MVGLAPAIENLGAGRCRRSPARAPRRRRLCVALAPLGRVAVLRPQRGMPTDPKTFTFDQVRSRGEARPQHCGAPACIVSQLATCLPRVRLCGGGCGCRCGCGSGCGRLGVWVRVWVGVFSKRKWWSDQLAERLPVAAVVWHTTPQDRMLLAPFSCKRLPHGPSRRLSPLSDAETVAAILAARCVWVSLSHGLLALSEAIPPSCCLAVHAPAVDSQPLGGIRMVACPPVAASRGRRPRTCRLPRQTHAAVRASVQPRSSRAR